MPDVPDWVKERLDEEAEMGTWAGEPKGIWARLPELTATTMWLIFVLFVLTTMLLFDIARIGLIYEWWVRYR